ncbi:MAG TPA: DNA-directed RNA polymerase subunit beta [Fimbriimonadaceae bacterium]|nr:DNA-directed RNA polymerase subunit beta [Fimbriimonadaceae bacterium]
MKVIQPSSKRIGRFLEVPNLIELQLNSYKWFLEEGLPELFKTFSPIWDFTQTNYIEFADFILGEPKYSLSECRDRDLTFEAPIKATVRFGGKDREVIESEVYLGDLPLMTDNGTFVINGRERVIVSQLSRSPGLYFEEDVDTSMQMIVRGRIIPMEGPWLEVENDSNKVVTTQISQTKKLPITQLIKALHGFERGRDRRTAVVGESLHKKLAEPLADPSTGEVILDKGTILTGDVLSALKKRHHALEVLIETPLGNTEEMLWAFGTEMVIEKPTAENLVGKRPLEDIAVEKKVIVPRLERITEDTVEAVLETKPKGIRVLEIMDLVEATLAADKTANTREAILDIYKRMMPGEAANEDAAMQLCYSLFFDPRRYDLGRVGRRFLNQRLKLDVPLDIRNLTSDDLAQIMFAMGPYLTKDAERDDIDDLRNKRVRSVGELLQSQLRLGFVRMEKVARERMTSADQENLLPSIILSVKPVSASIKSFFSSNQLSTFMDQTNPLSELTNKRRLSSLGPGGLQRTSAKLEVRDVHRSHYGRICPIETPEGPNIGLISQLTTHARVDEFGFIMTPYRKVKNGVVQDDVIYLTAQEDFTSRVAPADTPLDKHGKIVEDTVTVRCQGGDAMYGGASYPTVPRNEVDLMDVSPVQIISVATSLIPFLENDDANRALMGANMQRQAVPCLRSDAPIVGTGHERRAAVDAGAAVVAHNSGTVTYVDSHKIVVSSDEGDETYPLMHMFQSNKSTCFTHRPVVFPGDQVQEGDPLADGATCDEGMLALGQNLVVAFMPWGGYNYEDAILLSERLVKDDVFTSIHIERHEAEAVDTKLGPEEITRDIPNVGEEALKDLDENGIIRVGAEVRPEDILVGKVAPKGQTEMTAEERLIIAIFGKKAEETRDVSLRVPHGEKGTVVDVKVFSRFKYLSPTINYIYKESKKRERLICDRTDEPLLQIPGDELPAGTNMSVQVYVAQKRKIMVGDKMAGRHGNKGVISRILPVEDMPMLQDGTPVDIILNPLGVPSRMNIGQILETHLGYAGMHLGVRYVCPAFEGATEHEILSEVDRLAMSMRAKVLGAYCSSELSLGIRFKPNESLEEMFETIEQRVRQLDQEHLEEISRVLAASPTKSTKDLLEADVEDWRPDEVPERMGEPAKASDEVYKSIMARVEENVFKRSGLDPKSCKSIVRDGLTGDILPNPITVGTIYMLKLEHLADEKIHARSIGPYSLVTQQPLGGKAQFGGQRFGEMEVWALEAYGAAYTLQELLTIKSDDVVGRVKAYESIVKGESIAEPGIPESFKILVNELRSLCLKVSVEDRNNRELTLKDLDELAGNDDVRLARSVGFFN